MGDGGGEGKRGEGGKLAGNSHREGYCPEGAFLGKLRKQSEKTITTNIYTLVLRNPTIVIM